MTALFERLQTSSPIGLSPSTAQCVREQQRRSWALQERIDEAFADLLSNELVWAMRPNLGARLIAANTGDSVGIGLPPPGPAVRKLVEGTRQIRRIGFGKAARSAALRLRGTTSPRQHQPPAETSLTNGILRVWSTENQRLAVSGRKPDDSLAAVPSQKIDLTLLGDDLVGGLKEACSNMGARPDVLLHEISITYWLRRSIKAHLDRHRPAMVISSTNQSRVSRLLNREARRRGVPSVYVPHAPTALNRVYAELTADLALLRGQNDVHYYTWCGAKRDQLRVVGDPTLQHNRADATDSPPTIAIATSVDRSARELRRFLKIIADSGISELAELIVAPHPRGRRDVGLLAPRFGLKVFEGRTGEALRHRNVIAMVSEASSGVIMEAESLGIPTVALSPHPNYVFECDLRIQRISSGDELRSAISAMIAARGTTDHDREAALAAWVACSGDSARSRIDQELSRGVALTGPALDNWSTLANHRTEPSLDDGDSP